MQFIKVNNIRIDIDRLEAVVFSPELLKFTFYMKESKNYYDTFFKTKEECTAFIDWLDSRLGTQVVTVVPVSATAEVQVS